jgi:hypothetical protein
LGGRSGLRKAIKKVPFLVRVKFPMTFHPHPMTVVSLPMAGNPDPLVMGPVGVITVIVVVGGWGIVCRWIIVCRRIIVVRPVNPIIWCAPK